MHTILAGHFLAQSLHAIAVLGVADLIDKGLVTIEQLAAATETHLPSLHRLMRAVTSAGVFTENPTGHFALTPLGATLRSDALDSQRDKAIFWGATPVRSTWDSLLETLQRGQPAFPKLYETNMFRYFAAHADLAVVFNRFMSMQSKQHNDALLEAYDFSGVQTLVDVGGGYGGTLAAILSKYRDMRGILFDLPEMIESAPMLELSTIADHCKAVGGDMFKSVPAGGDLYLIKRVMMDLTDDGARSVLSNCIAAMKPGGKALIVDPVLSENGISQSNWFLDIHMMVLTGGQCRTQTQFLELLDDCGMTLARVIATGCPDVIIEGVVR